MGSPTAQSLPSICLLSFPPLAPVLPPPIVASAGRPAAELLLLLSARALRRRAAAMAGSRGEEHPCGCVVILLSPPAHLSCGAVSAVSADGGA